MRSHRFLTLLTAAALCGAAGEAQAQTQQPQVALNRFEPSFAGDRMFGVQSPFSAGHPGIHVALLTDYAHNPLVLRQEGASGNVGAIVAHQLFLHLNATLSLWHRLSINFDVPAALFQKGNSPMAGDSTFISPSSAQFGDLRAGVRVRIWGEYHDPFQIALGGYIWFPTGAVNSFVSDKTVRGLPQVIVGGRAIDRIVWTFAVGPEIRGSQDIANTATGTSLRWGAGLGVLLLENRHLQLAAEYSGSFVFREISKRTLGGELLGSVRYRIIDDLEVGAGAGPGLASAVGTPDFRAIGMIAYTPEQHKAPLDRDGDGIADPQDACPDEPGPKSEDPKKNGCPPRDRDKDGILDDVDACPDEAGVASEDPKKHGCPLRDRDKDGVLDDVDACPDVAGVASDDPKKNGCPPDRDGDGILDAEDACPDAPGPRRDDPKQTGCPDTDGDGIIDPMDACPNEPGPQDPDPNKNGCPTVRVTEGEIVILEQVQFDTGKATIKKVSDPLLDKVAAVFKSHPEILRVEVQGHTDNKGSRPANKQLSQARADAVLKALVKRGIEKKRLIAKGYGQEVPIADNNTDAGRQENRRVQFKIMDKAGKKADAADNKPEAPARKPAPPKPAPPKPAPPKPAGKKR